jgi:hypothetical protein
MNEEPMPYIKPQCRPALDPIIDGLLKRLREIKCKRGDLNYVVTRLVVEALNKNSYHSISDCVSVLRDSADEIARRLLGPYEDTAILKNGDMACFQTDYAYHPQPTTPLPSPIPPFGPSPVNEVDGNTVVDSPLSGDPLSDDVPPIEKTTRELIDAHIEWRKSRDLAHNANIFCDNNPKECEGTGPTDD